MFFKNQITSRGDKISNPHLNQKVHKKFLGALLYCLVSQPKQCPYRIVQNILGTKPWWLDHFVSIFGKTFAGTSRTTLSLHQKYSSKNIYGLTVLVKTIKITNFLSLKCFVPYHIFTVENHLSLAKQSS